MLLVDYSQISIAAIFSQTAPNEPLSEGLCRHTILKSILSIKLDFSHNFGNPILCVDAGNYWRKDHFEYYKAKRKTNQVNSPYDWAKIHELKSQVIEEIRNHFPYKVITVPRAEADDVIASLVKHSQTIHEEGFFSSGAKKVLIVSDDNDYIQLQKYPNVSQWSPKKKMFIRSADPIGELKEKIIIGDESDGIPNIRSDADTFVTPGKRQFPARKEYISLWKSLPVEQFEDPGKNPTPELHKRIQDNFMRNQKLIDFSFIPKEIEDDAISQYELPEPTKRSLVKYFEKNRLLDLYTRVNEI